MSATQQAGTSIHAGVIASVVIVSLLAIAAAVLIIRKYCVPVNERTYRYSVLRRLEEQGSEGTDDCSQLVDSDEELLE